MADEVDNSNDHAERILAAQTANARAKASSRELLPVGRCWYCDCTVARGQLFCDTLCRDDHQAEQEALARNGR